MKRYWKLIVLSVLIVFGIGSYYVESTARNRPQYYLETMAGNQQAAASVSLKARNSQQSLLIGTGGTKYQSYWASLDANYYSDTLNQLIDTYPQFMRGKYNSSGFYVDSHIIGYANIKLVDNYGHAPLYVSVYDKDQKTSASFTVEVPFKNNASFASVIKVVISGHVMNLVTMNTNNGVGGTQSVHLYTLNLDNKSIVSNQTILSVNSNSNLYISQSNGSGSMQQPGDYMFFIEGNDSKPPAASHNLSVNYPRLFVYDVRTGVRTQVKNQVIDKAFGSNPSFDTYQVGNEMYFVSPTETQGQWHIIRFDLADKKVDSDFTILLNKFDAKGPVMNNTEVSHHRLYMLLTPSETSPTGEGISSLAIINLDTRRLIYQGVVTRKDPNQMGFLQIYGLSIH